ncbi:hypothetical protein CH381_25420 [Leptospira sp. mixed culture ATI2-C-A1]|nr:hypothetical protein CH381_25420 [Leptospira sp. mixed culture ATI2-C-A1]
MNFETILNFIKLFPTKPYEGYIIAFFLLLIGWILRLFFERFSWKTKLKTDYEFNQRRKIKEKISNSKNPLLKAAEELNYRLWNFNQHIDENWHSLKKNKWKSNQNYYLKSFVYRFLVFYYWILEAELSIYHLDSMHADKYDKKYMLYLKTLKHIIADKDLLQELDYKTNDFENHFYKDNIPLYTKYCKNKNGEVIEFSDFSSKVNKDLKQIEKVFLFISSIENKATNKNYNIIVSLHLVLMRFLNEFGLDYQKTSKSKIKKLIKKSYHKIRIKNSFISFLKRNKILNEMKPVLNLMNLGFCYRILNFNKIKEFEI